MAAPMTSSAATARPTLHVSGRVTLTHKIDDPAGALDRVPGGARAIADLLNRGTDATGLYRNLQHAAGLA
jgi:hypothetical protein